MNRLSPPQIVGIAIGAVLATIVAFFVANPGLISKVVLVVEYNYGMWILCSFGIAYAIFRKIRNPRELTWLEFPVQVLTSVTAVFLFYCIFYYSASGMMDWEIWSGYVSSAEYYEEWTECTTYTDSDGNTQTTYTYHAPEWQLVTNNGENVGVGSSVYHHYVNYWGKKETKKTLFHVNQSSFGDGNMYYTAWPNNPDLRVPSAVEHHCVNYLKASRSIRRRTSSIGPEHLPFLASYPVVHAKSAFGPIDFDRVVDAKASVPQLWRNKVDKGLDDALCSLGKLKEVNILVYVMGTADQSYVHALEEHWIEGKKNDVILVIGTSQFPTIDWVSVIAWTDVEEFKILLRDRILALQTLEGKEQDVVDIITDQVRQSPQNGGFKRREMRELTYLIADIRLPWWAQLIVIVFSGLCAYGTSWSLENNEISEQMW